MDVYLEIGKKRTFAVALAWPGYSRAGNSETSALQALVDYGPRYALVVASTRLPFEAPAAPSAVAVVERLAGDASTDFGAPGAIPAHDHQEIDDNERQRLQVILQACWLAFDRAVEAARGRALRKGPRGGGRELDEMARHVADAAAAYLRRLGWQETGSSGSLPERVQRLRQAEMDGLAAAARGEIAPLGPRRGARWPAPYFVRRAAWHLLDHAWEIEDRAQ